MEVHAQNCDCYDCFESQNHFAKDFSGSIKWNSEPLLANPLLFLKDWWDAKTWIKWHSLVKEKYGQKRANEVLLQWFDKAPFGSPTTDFRTFDDEFIAYAKKEKFYDGLFTGVLGQTIGRTAATGKKAIDTTGKIIDSAGDLIEEGGDILQFLSKNIKWVLIGIIVMLTLYFYTQIKK